MRLKKFPMPMISLAILISLQGCAHDMGDLCKSYRLITVSPQDKLTPRTAENILHDDDQYEAICR